METSILQSVKKVLNLDPGYTAFDQDILLHINGTFLTLNQLGIGPAAGFSIEDETAKWSDYIGSDPNLNAVKTLVYLKVRMLFDPPETSFTQEAMNRQIEQLEWRLNVYAEGVGTSQGGYHQTVNLDVDPNGAFILEVSEEAAP